MSAPIISVEHLSKRYLVGHRVDRGAPFQYVALRDIIGRELRNATRKAVDVMRGRQVVQGDQIEEFWALNDVSFEVKEGEVLGIIGRNGAGKSTLLKILSRITEPSAGRVTLRGRVASLLEVGTGFHPELSGSENIFLNGAILGMSRGEIRKKFDEIVAFAEIEKFIDTPVKRYSSGMYVRLAFAVAAHLEPEILIVDEVLAVGDAEFQKKCLGKMNEVSSREGRTVLFVSHNMAAIERLASRALLINRGNLEREGDAPAVIGEYLASDSFPKDGWDEVENLRRTMQVTGEAVIRKLRMRNAAGIPFGAPLTFDISTKIVQAIDRIRVSFTIFDISGAPVGSGFSRELPIFKGQRSAMLTTTVASIKLAPGQYYMGVAIGRGDSESNWANYDAIIGCMYFNSATAGDPGNVLPKWERAWGPIVISDVEMNISVDTASQTAVTMETVVS